MLALASAPAAPRERMRPFDITHDLAPLADLVDVAFSAEPDGMRRNVVSEMRRAANAGPLLWLAAADPIGLSTMGGFVWVAGRRLVGNVTLSRDSSYADLYVISNVAVHPDWRGRGIAAQMLRAALQEAERRSARLVVLEVEQDNAIGHHLYEKLGFATYDSVAELRHASAIQSTCIQNGSWPGPGQILRRQKASDAASLLQLVREVTPPPARLARPPREKDYRLDLGTRFDRFMDDLLYRRQHVDWVVERNGRLIALLQGVGQFGSEAHRLRMEVALSARGTLENELLRHGLTWLTRFPERPICATVSCTHPEALSALSAAGFETMRVLDQMQLRPGGLADMSGGNL